MRVLRVAVVWSFAGFALGVAGLLAAGGAGASAAEGVRTGPAGAAFYRPPASLPRVRGAPIWMRAAQGGDSIALMKLSNWKTRSIALPFRFQPGSCASAC